MSWDDEGEYYGEPVLGDHGTCGVEGCGRELTLAVVGPGPVIEGTVGGVAVDWVHTALLDVGVRYGVAGAGEIDMKASDLKLMGHYAQLGGPA